METSHVSLGREREAKTQRHKLKTPCLLRPGVRAPRSQFWARQPKRRSVSASSSLDLFPIATSMVSRYKE